MCTCILSLCILKILSHFLAIFQEENENGTKNISRSLSLHTFKLLTHSISTFQEESKNATKDKLKKKSNGKSKEPSENPPQSSQQSGTVKNGANASTAEEETVTVSKRRQNMDPPLVPHKKIKKSKQKRALGTPFIVKELESEKNLNKKGKVSDGESIFKAPGAVTAACKGSNSDHDGSDDSLEGRFSLALNDSYDSIGTLKLESGKEVQLVVLLSEY